MTKQKLRKLLQNELRDAGVITRGNYSMEKLQDMYIGKYGINAMHEFLMKHGYPAGDIKAPEENTSTPIPEAEEAPQASAKQPTVVDVREAAALMAQAIKDAQHDKQTPVYDSPDAAPVGSDVARMRAIKDREASALRRVQVTCHDPQLIQQERRNYTVQVGNSYVSTQRYVVPFDVPWHVTELVYNVLKERTHTVLTETNPPKTKIVKSFSIVDLPPLTPEEAEKLKKAQEVLKEADDIASEG